MTRFVDLIAALLTTWTNFEVTPQIIKAKRETKRKSINEGIVLLDATDEVFLATNGSLIYANRKGEIEIYGRNTTDVDNLYADIIANFVDEPVIYSEIESPDIRNRHKMILQATYLES